MHTQMNGFILYKIITKVTQEKKPKRKTKNYIIITKMNKLPQL